MNAKTKAVKTKAVKTKAEPTPLRTIYTHALSDNQHEVLKTALSEFVYTRCADTEEEEEGVFNYINSRYADHTASFRAAKHRKVLHRVRVAKALLAQLNNPYIFNPSKTKTEFVAPISFRIADMVTSSQFVSEGGE
jgi:hypothetical protein